MHFGMLNERQRRRQPFTADRGAGPTARESFLTAIGSTPSLGGPRRLGIRKFCREMQVSTHAEDSSLERRSIKLHLMDESVESELLTTLKEFEERLKIEGLSVTLFNVIMELVGNAVKANLKRVFFERHGFDSTDPDSYHRGIEQFTQNYRHTNTEEYRRALKELELQVTIDMDLDSDRLLIHVRNNTVLLAEEERRIRTKLAQAMGTKDIMNFYIEFGDETEGKGLGLAMVILLIKDLGFDPSLFRVFHDNDRTIARLEFPLSANYVAIRERAAREGRLPPG